MINCVFGISECSNRFLEDDKDFYKDKIVIYISESDVWEKEECCSDYLSNEAYEAIKDLNISEEMEGVYITMSQEWVEGIGFVDIKPLSKKELFQELIKRGFTYNKKFEKFMLDFDS